MKENLTELVFILDRSGSMSYLKDDTIGGFNSMIKKQKQEPGEAFVTTVLFNSDYTLLHDHVNIKNIQPMTKDDYMAYGLTAFNDALGATIHKIGERLNDTPEDERPDKVIFVIITDGFENASTRYTKERVKETIEHQQSKYSWTFIFLGANMDAVEEAGSYGINQDFAKTYTASSAGTSRGYDVVAKTLSCARLADFDPNDKSSAAYKITIDTLNEVI